MSASITLASAIASSLPGPWSTASATARSTSAGRGWVELAGHRGDLAGDPQVAAALPHRGVELGQPVPQVQAVGHQRPDGQGVLAPGDRELTDRQVHHLRGAGPTEPDQPRPTRRHRLPVVAGVVGVQVGPVQRQLQLTHLHRPPVPHRRLHRSQRLGSVEVLDGEKAGRLRHDSTKHSPPTVEPEPSRPIHRAGDAGSQMGQEPE